MAFILTDVCEEQHEQSRYILCVIDEMLICKKEIVSRGLLRLIEDRASKLQIALANYSINAEKKDEHTVVVIDAGKASYIKLEYDRKRPIIESIMIEV